MRQFSYTAKDKNGRTIRGRESANSEHEAVLKLMRLGFTIISIEEVIEKPLPGLLTNRRGRIRTFDLIVLCKQLAAMIKGGVPFIRAIDTIASETKNKSTMQAVLTEVSHSVRDGNSFSSTLKRMPHLFSPLFIASVEAGEKVGALPVMLERLSTYLSASDRLRKKVLSAISYPSVILIFFCGAMAIMTLFLIPRFKSMYDTFNAELPPITQAVFQTSDFALRHILVISLLSAAIFFLAHRVFFKTRKGREFFDGSLLKIPVFGEVLKKAAVSKFTRTLSTLLGQGIAVPQSLELVSKAAGNMVIENAGIKSASFILQGDKIPDAFKKTGAFPSLMIQMVTTGVDSGKLPELLDKTADFYEDEVDTFVTIMSSLIEPILIVSLGLVLGIVIVALYMPIFKLSQAAYGGAR